jgi:hypothetical protein
MVGRLPYSKHSQAFTDNITLVHGGLRIEHIVRAFDNTHLPILPLVLLLLANLYFAYLLKCYL